MPLAEQRRDAVARRAAASAGARRVLDLGCGQGAAAARRCSTEPRFTEIVGVDVSPRALAIAARRLRLDRMPSGSASAVELLQGVADLHATSGWPAYDAAVLMEVDRAPRPAAAGRAGARGVRARPAADGGRDHAERRVQRPLARRCRRAAAAPRPPVRVDPRGVRGLGGRRRPRAYGYAVQLVRRRRRTTPRSGRRPSWRCSRRDGERPHEPQHRTIPELVPASCSGRRLRLGQVDLRRASTSCRPRWSRRDVCRGLVADDENDQVATGDAFDVLHYIVGQAAGGAGGSPSSTPPTCSRDARGTLVELAKEHDVLPVAIVLDVPEEVCAGAQRGRAPDRRLRRHVVRRQQPRPAPLAAAGWQREGFRKVHVLRGVGGGRGRRRSSASGCSTTAATCTARSTSSATCTAAAPSWRPLLAELGYAWARRRTAGRSTRRTPRAVRRCSSATWSTAARTPPACCGW